MRHLALPLLLIQLLMLTSAPLPGQTTVRKLFNRAYQFDPNGLTSQTAVQPFEELPSSSFSWGKNGLSHYGNRFYAAYARRPHTNTFIFLKTSPDGTTWSNPVQVSDSLGVSGASYPSVAFWGDPALPNICIVYTDVFPGGAELRATVSSDGGQSFSPSVRIDDHAGVTNILPDLAIDDAGTLYVSWNRSVGSNWYTTYFSSSSDGGQTWSPQITVHTGRVFSYPSRIVARGNGEVLIGICDDQNSKSNLVVYTSNNSGDSWQLATQATNYAFSHGFRWFSVMKDAADNVHFVHPYYENGIVQEVRHINSNDWGSSWSSVHSMSDPSLVPLQNGANQRNMPYLTFTQQGNLYAAWADHRNDPAGNEYEVYLTRSLDGGLSWAPEVQVNIPDNVQEHSYPILAATGDGNRDTLSIIWSQVYNLAGGNPPNPFNLVGPADQSVFATSTIFFSWQQSSDPDGDPVSYSLRIWEMSNPAADTTISGISGTNRGFDGAGFLRAGRSYSWTVEASDGQNTTPSLDIFTFSLLPSDFAVFPEAPANGSQLADSQAPVEFRWRSEITRASGPLTYTLHITGTEGDTSITAISDTTFSFDGSTFFEGSRGYCWAVEASDGSASVTSATFSLFTPAGVMGGIYRIGPCGDFPDIDGAIGALNAYGNHQPTTLRIAPGIYPLSAVLAAPSGISGDPVVFESENGDPQSVEIRHAAANGNFMLQINGYPNVSFRQLHFH
ncbi:MAG: exo-alpha-sialidase, partial [Calditrichaeota bacterium]|nr:exo-alpha-sialidase [Calditrichota bacterium]